MKWTPLQSEAQINDIKFKSDKNPQVIFKHSTRCSISSMAKNRIDRNDKPEGVDFYYLDIINYRTISNKIAEEFDVDHQSPQVLIINDGQCVYNESHSGIHMDEIKSVAEQL